MTTTPFVWLTIGAFAALMTWGSWAFIADRRDRRRNRRSA